MLTLYQFPGPWDVISASPFCAKLEAFLRWQKIDYKSVTVHSTRAAPKGKIPYIEDENGKLGDSGLIIEYLCEKHGLNPYPGLTDAQKAAARGLHYLCEESLYRIGAYLRWIDAPGWGVMERDVFGKIPGWIRPVIAWSVRRYVRKQLVMQGMGRHSRDEIIAIAIADLKALAELLGDTPYFFGDAMTLCDLTVFSVVANLAPAPFINPVSDYARSIENLMAHAGHVRERCFTATAHK